MPPQRALNPKLVIFGASIAVLTVLALAFSGSMSSLSVRAQVVPDLGSCCQNPGPGQSCVADATVDDCADTSGAGGFFIGYGAQDPGTIHGQCSIACGLNQESSSSSGGSGNADVTVHVSCMCTGMAYTCTAKITNVGPDPATGISAELDLSGNLEITGAPALQGPTIIPVQSQTATQVVWSPSGGPLLSGQEVQAIFTVEGASGQSPTGSVSFALVGTTSTDTNMLNNTSLTSYGPNMCTGASSSAANSSSAPSNVACAAGGNCYLSGTPRADGSQCPSASLHVCLNGTTDTPTGISCMVSGCAGTCFTSCTEASSSAAPSVCGNGKLEAGELCDDGNGTNNDCCSSQCTVEQGCSCQIVPVSGPSFP